jgi:hypothetical protein
VWGAKEKIGSSSNSFSIKISSTHVALLHRFGRDPSKWVQLGEANVSMTEEGGLRMYRSTSVMLGIELSLFLEPACFEPRYGFG